VSDLSELFEQLADGPVLLATAFDSANADCDNGTTLQRQDRAGLRKRRRISLQRASVDGGIRKGLGL
jgi:hypothetical protein